MAHIQKVDKLVKEYLLFRGFTGTIKALDNEIKNDKDKSFRPDKIVDQIQLLINSSDLLSLRKLWSDLELHLFNKLEHTFLSAIKKLEAGILKLYLVTAHINGKSDKILEFFSKLSPELQTQSDWRDWFCFPFCKNPEENPTFTIFFTKQWQDTLLISLHNFLSIIFQSISHPVISKIGNESILICKLQEENSALRSRLQTLTKFLQTSSSSTTNSATISSSSASCGPLNDILMKQNKHIVKNLSTTQHQLDDVICFDVSPPHHVVDDFYIIASETVDTNQMAAENQSRGLKQLIKKNISSGSS